MPDQYRKTSTKYKIGLCMLIKTSSTFSTFPSFKINRSTNRLLALETSGKAIKFNIMIHKETMIPPISMRKGAILKLISLNEAKLLMYEIKLIKDIF
ncbi:hypothetical protein BMETH_530_2 [methanotrophic bacterial endosymbiont of Bathymodiolus sp.]|nr:hypothetical protein BMETH_530_2 [methanotrophic bacterial endosymbiont of Bathymodiolus sp.]